MTILDPNPSKPSTLDRGSLGPEPLDPERPTLEIEWGVNWSQVRSACIGFTASVISDTASNSIRVIKTVPFLFSSYTQVFVFVYSSFFLRILKYTR